MNEAVRRGAWTCIGCSTISRAPQAMMASAPKHQRKHSSSKASSSSKHEPRPITTATVDKATTGPPAIKRTGGRRSPRTASKPSPIKARLEAYPNIPSVPSTSHLHPKSTGALSFYGVMDELTFPPGVHVASFFSRHRPISVTTSFPPASSESAFSSIFGPKPLSKTQSFDVINAVSSAIDNLENAAFQAHEDTYTEPTHMQSTPSRRSNSKAVKHLDSINDNDTTTTQVISLDISDLSQSFRHFVPPPPPVPQSDVRSSTTSPASSPSKRRSVAPVKERTYSTTLTIVEHIHPSGESTYAASVSPIVRSSARPPKRGGSSSSTSLSSRVRTRGNEAPMMDVTPPSSSFPSPSTSSSSPPQRGFPPQPFLERMRKRQQVWEDGMTEKKRQIWQAISVKRQRKLKMKKHKYKKLMRKTRNLRRRLDRN
ncbi:MAG: hypothetical protein LQ346_002730 [Caloplaca aetnensis]|nr:MAG: hypothetical protein LQ346_002730 [Caloplaca aetnensis]